MPIRMACVLSAGYHNFLTVTLDSVLITTTTLDKSEVFFVMAAIEV
jgi:hypothetical protein